MSTILALDTSTEACSCALNINGRVLDRLEIAPRQHATLLLSMIKKLMADCSLAYTDLDAIAVGCGPGSFTGLRIASGVAQGIAFGASLPVIPVSTLAALAVQAHNETGHINILSCMDARIEEVYWAAYQFSGAEPVLVGCEELCKAEEIKDSILESSIDWYGAGSGMAFRGDMQGSVQNKINKYSQQMYPRAKDVAHISSIYYEQGLMIDPVDLVPVYLRDKVTHG